MIGRLTARLNKKENGRNSFSHIVVIRFKFAAIEKGSKSSKNGGVFP